MRALSLLTTCGLLLATAAPAPAAAQAGAKAGTPAERPAGNATGWWNDPAVAENLGLGEEQRKKMDGYFASFREKLQAAEGPATRNEFTEALKAGDWKKARGALDKLAEESALPIQAHGELKIEVLSVLSKEQLAKLVEGYPRLIQRPWVRVPRQRTR